MNKHDLRFVKTEELIRQTFKACVYEFGFDGTRVSDICARAKISRNTFYAHYEDKHALLSAMFKEVNAQFMLTYTDALGGALWQKDYRSNVKWYVETVAANADYYRFFLDCSPEKFTEMLMEVVFNVPNRKRIPHFDVMLERNKFIQLNTQYLFSAMIGFTKYWLQHLDELDIDEVIDEFCALSREPLDRYLEKLQAEMDADSEDRGATKMRHMSLP